MFDPPAGFNDMLGDADDAPHSDRFTALTVPGVGVVVARKPMPAAIPLIAGSVNAEVPDTRRPEYAARFVQTHLGEGEWERIHEAMLDDAAPDTAVQDIAAAVATWGTARPHHAVLALALQTAYLWRAVRLRLVLAGIRDPMRLPTMHLVFDVTEKLMVESMAGPDGEEQQTRFFNRLYGPAPHLIPGPKGKGQTVPPAGFSPEEMAASWKAWTSAQGAAAR